MRLKSLLFIIVASALLLTQFAWSSNQCDKLIRKLPPLLSTTETSVSLEQWEKRRQEIKFLLQDQVYGFLPPQNIPMSVRVVSEKPLANGLGSYRDVRLEFKTLSKEIKLAVFLPVRSKANKIGTTFLIINKCGNHTVVDDPAVTESGQQWLHAKYCYDHGVAFGRGSDKSQYALPEVLSRGDILVTWAASDMAADSPRHPSVGLKGVMEPTSPDPKKNWGVLMAWAWGQMRAMDYLANAEGVEPHRVVVVGHSRRGKAALLAAAFDERFAAVIAHQSGVGGTALMRASLGRETPHMITSGWFGYSLMGEADGLTHFFASGFDEISADVNSLAFDAHFLVALVAPRPLLDFEGKKDFWAGPNSAAVALQAADQAWKISKGGGWSAGGRIFAPARIQTSRPGALVQYIMPGGHELTRKHWGVFLDFIDALSATKKNNPSQQRIDDYVCSANGGKALTE